MVQTGMATNALKRILSAAAITAVVAASWACSTDDMTNSNAVTSCAEPGTTLTFGYYAYFEPVSFVNPDESPYRHYGFESDLLTALESIDGANLAFERTPIEDWDGIWLKSSDQFDVVGGGITILESRTMDASGAQRVQFTNGHIAFRQSLLTRTADADRFPSYDDIGSDIRIGALPATTGEARFLQLAGLADADGVLAEGTRVQTPAGEVIADGSADYFITAADTAPEFDGRTLLDPPSDDYPTVVYLGGHLGETELLDALESRDIDAIARGEIGNSDAASASGGMFTVPLRDSESEWGGFTISADDGDLLDCINGHIDYLTDNRQIGYAEWLADPDVFMSRADSR